MLALLVALLPGAPESPDVAVVCPPAWQSVMEPWARRRTEQGHRLAWIDGEQPPEAILRQIRGVAGGGDLRYVVLAGDAEMQPELDGPRLAVHYVPARVVCQFGPEREIPSDNYYGDLDGDEIPDVAVGRLSADTPEQLATIVQKTLRYEECQDYGIWRRQVNLIAGVGNFGAVVDLALESAARRIISEGIPPHYEPTLTQANWQSPYCPPPARFGAVTLERLNEGSLIWAYMGHGHPRRLDQVRTPGGKFGILSMQDVPRLSAQPTGGVGCLLCCYAGAFDAPGESLAEGMLRQPGGPVAVLAASRVTMPYATTCLATEFMYEIFSRRQPTIGDAFLAAKRSTVEAGSARHASRGWVDALAGMLNPGGHDLKDERKEHLHLFNLMGDPLLRVALPRPLKLHADAKVAAGGELAVTADCPFDGEALVELVAPAGTLGANVHRHARYEEGPQAAEDYARTYLQANNQVLCSVETQVVKKRLAATLPIPRAARGQCFLRAYVKGSEASAAGSTALAIESQRITD